MELAVQLDTFPSDQSSVNTPTLVHQCVQVSPTATPSSQLFLNFSGGSHRYFLDIFSGASSPVSNALNSLHRDRIEPIDLIHGHDLLDDQIFESVLRLAASRLWQHHSVASTAELPFALGVQLQFAHQLSLMVCPPTTSNNSWQCRTALRFIIVHESFSH